MKTNDAKIQRLYRKAFNLVLPRILEKETVEELVSDKKSSSQHMWLATYFSAYCSFGLMLFTLPTGMVFFYVLSVMGLGEVGNFILWFLLGVPSWLSMLLITKWQFVHSFQKVHGIIENLPNKYFYGLRDLDLFVALAGGSIIGIIAIHLG